MNLRLGSLLPRVFVLVIVALLATATITFAAETSGTPTPNAPTESAAPTILLVPDVRGQAYVFAKTTLEEGGFAWRVAGSVKGYAANTVTSQSPAPGSRVYDTGAPTISLSLSVNSRYPQAGSPEQAAPFAGTPVAARRRHEGEAQGQAEGEAQSQGQGQAESEAQGQAQEEGEACREAEACAEAEAEASTKPARPAAFVVPGAKPEPLDEIPLTERAKNLSTWLSSHSRPTNENVSHWLYQHAWIVTGAKLGWWHGAQALETLIAVDEKVQRTWGMGKRSERVARAALAEVRKRSK